MNRFALADTVEVIAHRGFSAVAPENTLASLRAAMEAGADALEFDLQVSADGVAFLFHDDTLDRTTDGAGAIREWAARDLEGVDGGSWFGERFRGDVEVGRDVLHVIVIIECLEELEHFACCGDIQFDGVLRDARDLVRFHRDLGVLERFRDS